MHVVQAELDISELDISELHRLTPGEYRALVAEEAFGDSRVELLEGRRRGCVTGGAPSGDITPS